MILALKIMLSLLPQFDCHTLYYAADSGFMTADARYETRRKRI